MFVYKTKGGVSITNVALPILQTKKRYLKGKKNHGNSDYFTMQKYNLLKKKSSK
jgi:hypothetical protein